MRWTEREANAIVALRCCQLSGEEFWEARAAGQQLLTNLSHIRSVRLDLPQNASYFSGLGAERNSNKREQRLLKRTFQPSRRRRAKTHGFSVRMRTPGG